MKLTILGTGNAKVTKCYNTCFALNEDKEYFMIDGGGGMQKYCGCVFSEQDRYQKQIDRDKKKFAEQA